MSTEGTLLLRIITPEGLLFERDNLSSATVPLSNGSPIGIRPGHAPLIAETEKGIIHFRENITKQSLNLHAGVLEIRKNVITIFTAGEIDGISSETVETIEAKYDRLMQTLANQLFPDDHKDIDGVL